MRRLALCPEGLRKEGPLLGNKAAIASQQWTFPLNSALLQQLGRERETFSPSRVLR